MITLDKILAQLSPVSLNEIVGGFERGQAGGWSFGNMKSHKTRVTKVIKATKAQVIKAVVKRKNAVVLVLCHGLRSLNHQTTRRDLA